MLKVLVGLLLLPLSQVQSRELSYPQKMYATGLLCFERGDLSDGKNAWRKYQAFCRLSPNDCDSAARQKVEEYFLALNAERVDVVGETKAPVVLEVATPAPVQPVKVSKPKAPKVVAPSRPADPSKLVKEAERAREQGQLETALRYYELAEKMNPETKDFGVQIQELNELIQ